ncbi:MAG: hypothetical protein KZQ92_15640 [Candidatus Thiodiazotropha sp. (ex Lucinoma borealis)]|nr:hypothetical protein [Candidatus Thiodiazotropha sp. (ex Lucinoma borealis)]MCU7855204.1 hypothetical protein [Candidatus Thiodiazotropha sp. (ex Lucinoma borealis)]MCU7865397.1 hypothetical protein [Candidatus Thiodiazotropha sp. (ex Lucinoma borealis)]MCU7871016.1 hypothetical protein [Candidatus Thiodiazotropha sp. (ex Lucinoma borealis)]
MNSEFRGRTQNGGQTQYHKKVDQTALQTMTRLYVDWLEQHLEFAI